MYSQLTGIVILFGAALAVAWLMRAARLPTILGFLLAGMAVGPHCLNFFQPDQVHFFAELGLVLLLFMVGLELSPAPLLRVGRRLLTAAALQMLITTLAIAGLLEVLRPMPWHAALLLGIAVSLSSTAIVLKHLSDRSETDTPAGTLTTGILLFQDIAVIFVLVLLPLLATGSSDQRWWHAVGKIAAALAALVLVILVARRILPWVIRQVTRFGGRELMTLFAVVMAALGAWLADQANWSWPLGACIAGLLLAQTDLRHQLHAEIMPFRDVFNALFFLSVGMLADLDLFVQRPLAFGLLILAALVLKTLLTTAAVRAAHWPLRLSLAGGLGLCTISEFGYVLTAEADKLHLVPDTALSGLVLVAVGTMLGGALCLPVAQPLAGAIARLLSRDRPDEPPTEAAEEPPGLSSHVIIVGYGINGQNLARVLRATGIPFSVIEMNRSNTQRDGLEGVRVIVGDAARMSILKAAGLATARALVISIADSWATRQIIAQVHAARPELYILTRTRFISELDTLYRLGAQQVIPEEFETSIEIFAHVLKKFAVPDNVVEQQVKMVRAGRYGMLRGRPSDRTMRTEWLAILEAAVTQTYMLFEGSSAVGRTIRELDLRAKTGVTIVAVTRSGKPTTNPSPDFRLEAGDVLVLVGAHKQLDEAQAFLEPRADGAG